MASTSSGFRAGAEPASLFDDFWRRRRRRRCGRPRGSQSAAPHPSKIGAINSISIEMLSPGITISVPLRQVHRAGHIGRAEVKLRPVIAEKRSCAARPPPWSGCRPRTEAGVRGDRPRRRQHLPALHLSRLVPRNNAPMLSPASPWSSNLRNISTPVTTVLAVGRKRQSRPRRRL